MISMFHKIGVLVFGDITHENVSHTQIISVHVQATCEADQFLQNTLDLVPNGSWFQIDDALGSQIAFLR